MNAHEVAEINERRRQMGARELADELVAPYCAASDRLSGEDHDVPSRFDMIQPDQWDDVDKAVAR